MQGCETKDTKVVNLCLQVIQRLITSQVLDGKGAKYVVETMWMLMEANIEEVTILTDSLSHIGAAGETAADPDPAGDH